MKSMCTIGLAVLIALFASAMDGQTMGRNDSAALPSANAQVENQAKAVREILDPHTGDRWMLVHDPVHPGGPGRLVLAAETTAIRRDNLAVAAWTPASRGRSVPERPVIHAGDRLVVEEHTAFVDAELEGIALSPAIGGASLAVRLAIGGRVVQAEAVGPGRAALLPRSGAGR